MAKLHDYYKSDVVNELSKQFGYKTIMQVPRIEKITLNMGVGEAISTRNCWKMLPIWLPFPVRSR